MKTISEWLVLLMILNHNDWLFISDGNDSVDY